MPECIQARRLLLPGDYLFGLQALRLAPHRSSAAPVSGWGVTSGSNFAEQLQTEEVKQLTPKFPHHVTIKTTQLGATGGRPSENVKIVGGDLRTYKSYRTCKTPPRLGLLAKNELVSTKPEPTKHKSGRAVL